MIARTNASNGDDRDGVIRSRPVFDVTAPISFPSLASASESAASISASCGELVFISVFPKTVRGEGILSHDHRATGSGRVLAAFSPRDRMARPGRRGFGKK